MTLEEQVLNRAKERGLSDSDMKVLKERMSTHKKSMTISLSPEEMSVEAAEDAAIISENEGADYERDKRNNAVMKNFTEEPDWGDKRMMSAALNVNTKGSYYSNKKAGETQEASIGESLLGFFGVSEKKLKGAKGFLGLNDDTDLDSYIEKVSKGNPNNPSNRLSRTKIDALMYVTGHKPVFGMLEQSPYGEGNLRFKQGAFDRQAYIDANSDFIESDSKSTTDKTWKTRGGKVTKESSWGDLNKYQKVKGQDKYGHYIEINDINDYETGSKVLNEFYNENVFPIKERIYYNPKTRKVYDPFNKEEYSAYRKDVYNEQIWSQSVNQLGDPKKLESQIISRAEERGLSEDDINKIKQNLQLKMQAYEEPKRRRRK